MVACENRQGADVVEVAVGEENQVNMQILKAFELWKRGTADLLGMHTCVDDDVEPVELEQEAICADTAGGVQVSQVHINSPGKRIFILRRQCAPLPACPRRKA
jgi:hypothetical protein